MLDFQDIAHQLSVLVDKERPEQERLRQAQEIAQDTLEEHSARWHEHPEDQLARSVPWLVARPSENPTCTWPAPKRPTPMTVVATDGSQINPDPHYEINCCLINVSRIAFQYGTCEPPVMEAAVQVAIREIPKVRGIFNAQSVAAWRDQVELEMLLDVARKARKEDRLLVAIADGTLIRWMLQGIDSASVKQHFIEEFTQMLAHFRNEQLPLCAYTSLPNATEVANLLRVIRGDDLLSGLTDRVIFANRLELGERSALFESASHIKKAYMPEDQIFFFYIRVEGDIGRVEVPRWVAENKELVDLVHALVVSECAKGNGYPMILSEAHERAVVRSAEREAFYFVLEREMAKSGIQVAYSRKALSKRRPVI